MRGIRQIAAWTTAWAFLLSSAAGQSETAQFFFGTNVFPASILDRNRLEAETDHPELFQAPAIGDIFAYRVYHGTNLVREISGTVVSSNILECTEGPEIAIHDGNRLDLFKALYMTDALHRTPQTAGDESFSIIPAPVFELGEPGPAPRLPATAP